MTQRCFLSGIGGSGMSALAQILRARVWQVAGSDRSHDRGETPEKFSALKAQGIQLFPQDGSGLRAGLDCLIVSSAVEEQTPDVAAARRLEIPVRKRAEVLAEMFDQAPVSIGVAGTSGKSTITAMIGWILQAAGRRPTIMNGASMKNFAPNVASGGLGNAVIGGGEIFVSEVDESDGSIVLFHPSIAVISNLTVDHKPLPVLQELFAQFVVNTRGICVINLDDPESVRLRTIHPAKAVLSFALDHPGADVRAVDIKPTGEGVMFSLQVEGEAIAARLLIPGRHNVANALAAIAAVRAAGIAPADAARALGEFMGIARRFERVGVVRGVTVIDDFAHNPEKIAATLQTLHERPGRIWAIFQSHGFGPTKLMRTALADMLARELRYEDALIMPEIYYAGGTAARDISAADIIADVHARGKTAHFMPTRAAIAKFVAEKAKEGDSVVLMGARDDTLPQFAQDILRALRDD